MPLPPADTRPLFRPLTADIIRLLRTLTPEDWQRPTLAGTWRVRDVVAHLIDTALRRLSAGRDGVVLSTPDRPITNERELTAFINELNASWVRATRSLSTRVLVDLYAHVASDLSGLLRARVAGRAGAIPGLVGGRSTVARVVRHRA